MLQHVDGEQLVVKRSNWRGDRDPDQEQPGEKTEGAPSRRSFQRPNRQRSFQVDERREDENQSEKYRLRRSKSAVMETWHGPFSYGFAPDSLSSLSATSREASRAGACPFGCRVSRKATSAVVSAGLKFFPYAGMLPPP